MSSGGECKSVWWTLRYHPGPCRNAGLTFPLPGPPGSTAAQEIVPPFPSQGPAPPQAAASRLTYRGCKALLQLLLRKLRGRLSFKTPKGWLRPLSHITVQLYLQSALPLPSQEHPKDPLQTSGCQTLSLPLRDPARTACVCRPVVRGHLVT